MLIQMGNVSSFWFFRDDVHQSLWHGPTSKLHGAFLWKIKGSSQGSPETSKYISLSFQPLKKDLLFFLAFDLPDLHLCCTGRGHPSTGLAPTWPFRSDKWGRCSVCPERWTSIDRWCRRRCLESRPDQTESSGRQWLHCSTLWHSRPTSDHPRRGSSIPRCEVSGRFEIIQNLRSSNIWDYYPKFEIIQNLRLSKIWDHPKFEIIQNLRSSNIWDYHPKFEIIIQNLRLSKIWDYHPRFEIIIQDLRLSKIWDYPEFEIIQNLWLSNIWDHPKFEIIIQNLRLSSKILRLSSKIWDYHPIFEIIQYLRLSKIWDHPKFEIIQDLRSSKIWDHPRFEIIQYLRLSNIWDYYPIFEIIIQYLRLLSNIWDYYPIFEIIIQYLRLSSKILRLSSKIWDYYPIFEIIIQNLRLSSNIWDYHPRFEIIIQNLRSSSKIWDYHPKFEIIIQDLRLSSKIWDNHPKFEIIIQTLESDRDELFSNDIPDTFCSDSTTEYQGHTITGWDHPDEPICRSQRKAIASIRTTLKVHGLYWRPPNGRPPPKQCQSQTGVSFLLFQCKLLLEVPEILFIYIYIYIYIIILNWHQLAPICIQSFICFFFWRERASFPNDYKLEVLVKVQLGSKKYKAKQTNKQTNKQENNQKNERYKTNNKTKLCKEAGKQAEK